MRAKFILLLLLLALLGVACSSEEEPEPATSTAVSATAADPTAAADSTTAPEAEQTPAVEPTETAETPQPEPTTTVPSTNTPAPTNTATPTALPLTTHSWDAEPVLLEHNSRACPEACVGLYFSSLPNLILYSDGLLIIDRYDLGNRYYQLESKTLTRNEVCKLLNTIDLIGFLDYDSTAYYEQIYQLNLFPPYEPPNSVKVRAWDSNEVNSVGIRYFLAGGFHEGDLELEPALSLTYQLLSYLESQPLEPYVPERIIVSIEEAPPGLPSDHVGQEMGEWPLTDISLHTLFEASGGSRFIVEDAELVATLLNLFPPESEPFPQIYTENGDRYEMAIRGLLPYETLESIGSPLHGQDIIPGPDVPPSTTPLTCTLEDGVLDVYFSLLEGDM